MNLSAISRIKFHSPEGKFKAFSLGKNNLRVPGKAELIPKLGNLGSFSLAGEIPALDPSGATIGFLYPPTSVLPLARVIPPFLIHPEREKQGGKNQRGKNQRGKSRQGKAEGKPERKNQREENQREKQGRKPEGKAEGKPHCATSQEDFEDQTLQLCGTRPYRSLRISSIKKQPQNCPDSLNSEELINAASYQRAKSSNAGAMNLIYNRAGNLQIKHPKNNQNPQQPNKTPHVLLSFLPPSLSQPSLPRQAINSDRKHHWFFSLEALSCCRETAAPSGTNFSCLGDLGPHANNSDIAANF